MRDAGGSKEKLKAAFSLLLTMRGVPEIYSGDEIGMDGGEDPDDRRDFPGGFPGDAQNAFSQAGRTPDQQEVFSHVASLLKLRKEHPALREGRQIDIGWTDNSFAFVRETASERVLVVLNNQAQGQQTITFPLDDTSLQNAKALNCLFGPGEAQVQDTMLHVNAPAQSVTVCGVK
jgi:glycosidase